jgi:hypothetical protein
MLFRWRRTGERASVPLKFKNVFFTARLGNSWFLASAGAGSGANEAQSESLVRWCGQGIGEEPGETASSREPVLEAIWTGESTPLGGTKAVAHTSREGSCAHAPLSVVRFTKDLPSKLGSSTVSPASGDSSSSSAGFGRLIKAASAVLHFRLERSGDFAAASSMSRKVFLTTRWDNIPDACTSWCLEV